MLGLGAWLADVCSFVVARDEIAGVASELGSAFTEGAGLEAERPFALGRSNTYASTFLQARAFSISRARVGRMLQFTGARDSATLPHSPMRLPA